MIISTRPSFDSVQLKIWSKIYQYIYNKKLRNIKIYVNSGDQVKKI